MQTWLRAETWIDARTGEQLPRDADQAHEHAVPAGTTLDGPGGVRGLEGLPQGVTLAIDTVLDLQPFRLDRDPRRHDERPYAYTRGGARESPCGTRRLESEGRAAPCSWYPDVRRTGSRRLRAPQGGMAHHDARRAVDRNAGGIRLSADRRAHGGLTSRPMTSSACSPRFGTRIQRRRSGCASASQRCSRWRWRRGIAPTYRCLGLHRSRRTRTGCVPRWPGDAPGAGTCPAR